MKRFLLIFAYLSYPFGAVLLRFCYRDDPLCRHHSRHSMELFFGMVVLAAIWLVPSMIIMGIPYVGFPIVLGLSALASFFFCVLIVFAIRGLIAAARCKTAAPVPLLSTLCERCEPFFTAIGFDR